MMCQIRWNFISYATIPIYVGEHLRLYREVRPINIVCKVDQAINHLICLVDRDFGCFTLSYNDLPNSQLSIEKIVNKHKFIKIDVWNLYIDVYFYKYGDGEGIVLISPDKENITQSFKLDFDVTNNI